MAIDIKETSELLRLQSVSTNIYIELLTHGALSKRQLRKFIGKPDSEIETGLYELLNKGFVHSVKKSRGVTVYEVLSVLQLEERLEREREAITNLKKFVLPEITQPQKLGIIKYNGWEGIRKVYLEVLEEAIYTSEPILAFENIPDKEHSPIGKIFLESYLKKRFESNVLAKVIAPDTKATREYKESSENPFTQTVIFKNFHLKGTINIVGDLVMSYSTSPPQGTLRRDAREAHDFKQIFQVLWEVNQH